MTWNAARESTGLGPYRDIVSVTPNDAADLPVAGPTSPISPNGYGMPIYLFATVAGNVAVDLVDGSTRTLPVGAGFAGGIPMLVRRVRATGTTATGIFACYV
jgi:hypothetical protein